MGEVWIARNESTGADVAIKILRPGRGRADDAQERFRHEARIAAKLVHPNIARVYDLIEAEDGVLMLVMEPLRGETLRERLRREGALACGEALDVLLPICDALGAAHAAGVVHRDVTPGNIFLADERGARVPKLIDFGIAKGDISPVHTKTGEALGTPQYMSPEQIRLGRADGRSDEFSLAVTAYEAMTGTSPFKRAVASASLAAVLEADIDPDPRVPPRVWLVLSRALAKQAYERYATLRELGDALRAAVGDEPAKAPPSLRGDETESASDAASDAPESARVQVVPRQRRAWLYAVGGVLALGVSGVAAFGLTRPTATVDAVPSARMATPSSSAVLPPGSTVGAIATVSAAPPVRSATPSSSVLPPLVPRPLSPTAQTAPRPTASTFVAPSPSAERSALPIATTPGF